MLIIGVDCSTDIKDCGIATLDTQKKTMKLINKSKDKDILDHLYEEIVQYRRA